MTSYRNAASWRSIAPGRVALLVARAAKRAEALPGWDRMSPTQRQHAVSHEVLSKLAEIKPERSTAAFFVAVASAVMALSAPDSEPALVE